MIIKACDIGARTCLHAYDVLHVTKWDEFWIENLRHMLLYQ